MTEERLIEMIREMSAEFVRVLGVQATPEQVKVVEASIRQTFAGEKIYIAAYPRERARQLAQQAQHDARKLALLAGISERQARRVLRGK